MFLLFILCGIIWGVLVLVLLWQSYRILSKNHLVLGYFLVGRLFMTVSISSAVIGLFNLLIWSWINFGKWCLSRKLSISFKFFNVVKYRFLKYELYFLHVCCYVPPFISDFVNLDILSAFWLVWIKVCLFCWFFSKNQLFVSLFLCIVFFVSILLISALNLIVSCYLVLFGEFDYLF